MKLLATIFGATLLALTATAQPVLTTLYHFDSTNGANPVGRLLLGKDGALYGTTQSGGTNNGGTVFKISTGGILTSLATLNGTTGTNSDAGLTQGSNGVLYGAANMGGANGYGTVFQVTTNGVLTLLASFGGTNGTYPQADLLYGNDGSLYSTTSHGSGGGGYGTIFKLTTNGALSTLTNFNTGNGSYPNSGLTLGRDGLLYGVTVYGGNTNLNGHTGYGSIYKTTTNGVMTTLFNFSNTNGSYPYAVLTLGNDGNFYGTARFGGVSNCGTIFQITSSGAFTTLASFRTTNGAYPLAPLVLGGDGSFYGTTYQGGTNNNGTIFNITTNGTLTVLASFNSLNGAYPQAGLAFGSDGNIYGSTYFGGNLNLGTVFKLTLPAALRLRNFSVSNHIFQATVTGTAAPTVQIQFSTNLPPAWFVLTNLVFTTGTNQFTDVATNSHRFYRAMTQ